MPLSSCFLLLKTVLPVACNNSTYEQPWCLLAKLFAFSTEQTNSVHHSLAGEAAAELVLVAGPGAGAEHRALGAVRHQRRQRRRLSGGGHRHVRRRRRRRHLNTGRFSSDSSDVYLNSKSNKGKDGNGTIDLRQLFFFNCCF